MICPDDTEITELLEKSIEKGALGLKVLGGHYPMTPESTRRIIEIANSQKAYIAFHAGTCRYGSNVEGLLEAIELSKGLRTHIPHINSHCSTGEGPIEEILEVAGCFEEKSEHIRRILSGYH